ncbi:biotin/acetyl-CoA-carboxylase ligase [Nitratireductor aquibiodomus RA22]|uniref:biotin--[biotin carboxyl-carrier protein] ligase n=2 Tax=Nitratireductor aquibiodomus TaxID=204799 RepID=A0A1H4IMQ2_9HYPH|nr:biotin--[acetyl-CoA-carboxylase] ligase [Nitratireductor aquibiodomus]EIM75871.1 biotin/acetyl-CoA-carboxylase ligase [Nitratireductor aquibiodomus RA22]SEB34578.1 BirA family transcriptional regulator, biotin operon repressor / biotin-[acetyl-CoA-carboxylase] ligase [Nitratireductor aquibiodomus]
MAFRLAPSAETAGYRLEAHESVGSTNALALDHARAGDPGNLWVVASRQESGRGRRGREWATPPGNLAATLLNVGHFEPATAATLGFVAGLALSDALLAVVPEKRIAVAADGGDMPGGRFALKWPNDVLADGAKLSGILLESAILPDGRFAIAVGIGVNVVSHPDNTPYPATSLSALGFGGDAGDLFLALSDAWVDNSRLWNGGRGLDAIRSRWLKRAAGLGTQVSIRVDGRVARGTFETIDEACRFVIREADGSLLRIAAGDVHFGAVASAQAD